MTVFHLLLLAALFSSYFLARNYGRVVGKSYARLLFLLSVAGFIFSIVAPGPTSRLARAIGAHGTTDLVASLTFIALLVFCAATLVKFKQQERVYVKLVRELALRQTIVDHESPK